MYAPYAIEASIPTDMIQEHSALPYCKRNTVGTANTAGNTTVLVSCYISNTQEHVNLRWDI